MSKYSFKWEFKKRYGENFELASKELGKSTRTLRRYYKNNECDLTVKYLLDHLNNSYIHPNWQNIYWEPNGYLRTPYGICSASDVMLVHRYKWHSEIASNKIKKMKQLNQENDQYLDELQEQLLLTLGKIASRKIS